MCAAALTAPEMEVLVLGDSLQVSFDKLPPTAVVRVTVWKRGEELQVSVYLTSSFPTASPPSFVPFFLVSTFVHVILSFSLSSLPTSFFPLVHSYNHYRRSSVFSSLHLSFIYPVFSRSLSSIPNAPSLYFSFPFFLPLFFLTSCFFFPSFLHACIFPSITCSLFSETTSFVAKERRLKKSPINWRY